MSEGQGSSDEGRQGTADAGQEGTTTPPQGGQQGSADAGQQPSSDGSAAVIARLNAEAKQQRERAEAAEKKVTAFEQASLSEQEKAQKAAADAEARALAAETQLQQFRVGLALTRMAADARAIDPSLVSQLADLTQVQYDSNGEPTNLKELVDGIKKAHPILFGAGAGSADGGARGGTPQTSDMNALIRRGAGRG